MTSKSSATFNVILILLLCYAIAIYSVMTLRFLGMWGEGDTTLVTRAIISSGEADSLREAKQPYPNGVGYVAIVLFIHDIVGVPVQTLQTYIMPVLAALNILVLFVGYRAVIRIPWVALLATLFAYMQPDFIWVTWRGSHEKFTWMFVIMLVFLLARSFSIRNQVTLLGRYVLIFYLVTFALISSNVLFASSFVVAIVLSFAGGTFLFTIRKLVQRRKEEDILVSRQVQRLMYVNITCVALFYLFFFHLYPDSLTTLTSLKTLAEQLAALFLGTGEVIAPVTAQLTTSPGNYVLVSWLSVYVFVGLTAFSWGILGLSFIVWVVGVIDFLRKHLLDYSSLPRLFLWLVYPAFALQLAGALFADRVSVFSGNVQVRLFTPLMLVAIPLAALGLYYIIRYQERLKRIFRFILMAGTILAVFYFSIAAVLKATNEPLLNNSWIFSTKAENIAGDWAVEHLEHATVWTGTNNRLASYFQYRYLGLPTSNVQFLGFAAQNDTHYFLLSDLEIAMRQRLQVQPPSFLNENIVYSNGTVRVYYSKPLTPYQ